MVRGQTADLELNSSSVWQAYCMFEARDILSCRFFLLPYWTKRCFAPSEDGDLFARFEYLPDPIVSERWLNRSRRKASDQRWKTNDLYIGRAKIFPFFRRSPEKDRSLQPTKGKSLGFQAFS